jgi:triacylglycerol esterase/lipase EstA (alpha/beta hydrolase family)
MAVLFVQLKFLKFRPVVIDDHAAGVYTSRPCSQWLNGGMAIVSWRSFHQVEHGSTMNHLVHSMWYNSMFRARAIIPPVKRGLLTKSL